MTLQQYLRRRRPFEIAFWTLLFTIICISNVIIEMIEFRRTGADIPLWEPATWEASSMLTQLLLLPLILYLDGLKPLQWRGLPSRILWHLLFSVIFSAAHILAMVAVREGVYRFMGGDYDFGNWPVEALYEYLKDIRAYFIYITLIYLYRFILLRLQGEASPVEETERNGRPAEDTQAEPKIGERILVKKLGREFLVLTKNIERIEAAGNYVNLHVQGRVYPLRATMTGIEKCLDATAFIRVHRSHIVNLEYLAEIRPLETGDAVAKLRNGECVTVSRHYRGNLKNVSI